MASALGVRCGMYRATGILLSSKEDGTSIDERDPGSVHDRLRPWREVDDGSGLEDYLMGW